MDVTPFWADRWLDAVPVAPAPTLSESNEAGYDLAPERYRRSLIRFLNRPSTIRYVYSLGRRWNRARKRHLL